MAAWLRSSGLKKSTARTPRYRECAALKTPRRIESGVCASQDSAMITKVIQSACGRPGSVRTDFQLSSPLNGTFWVRPLQEEKLSTRTPTSGMRPKIVNATSAGHAIQETDALRPPLDAAGGADRTT